MSDETLRQLDLTQIGEGRYKAVNARGGVLPVGSGDDPDFTPVELLLASLAGSALLSTVTTACTMTPKIPPSVISAFTPTGKLRASINLGNPILANKDPANGQPVGVSIDLARAFAERLGVGIELVVFDSAGKSVDAVKAEQADIGFFAIDPLRGEVGQRVGRLGPHPLLEDDERDGLDRAWRRHRVDRAVGAAEQEHAQARGPNALGLSALGAALWQEHVRRAEHPVAVAVEARAAPLARGRERCRRRHRPARRPIRLGHRGQARVGPWVGGGQRTERPVQREPVLLTERLHPGQPHAVLGERAGLVGTHHVDAS